MKTFLTILCLSFLIPFVTATNLLYVSSEGSNQILLFDGDTGASLGNFTQASVNTPEGIAFAPDGSVYGASFGSNLVTRYDGTTGAVLDSFAVGSPVGLSFGPDGNLYIGGRTASAIIKRDLSTGTSSVFASGGGLSGPDDFTFGPDGNLYVSSRFSNQILRYNGTTGAFIDVFLDSSDGISTPEGIIFDNNGDIFIANRGLGQILKVDGNTRAVSTFISSTSPFGMTFGPDGNLYVSNFSSNTIERFNPTTGAFIDNFVTSAGGTPTFLTFDVSDTFSSAVPEPGSFLLLSFAIAFLASRKMK